MISDSNFNNFNFYLSGIIEEKENLRIIKSKKEKLDELLQKIDWKDIDIDLKGESGHTKTYKISFGGEINRFVEEIESIINGFQHLRQVAHEIIFGDEATELNCLVHYNSLSKRVDIPTEGLPISIRNLGLSIKIYRLLLTKEKYITSEERGLSGYGKLLWNSIRKSYLFYTFFTPTNAFIFASDRSAIEIIHTLNSVVGKENRNSFLIDDTFRNLNEERIENLLFTED